MCSVVYSVPLINFVSNIFSERGYKLFSESHIIDYQNVSMLCNL